MLRYLHVQVFPDLAPLASLMVCHGYFTLLPNNQGGCREQQMQYMIAYCLLLKGATGLTLTLRNCFAPTPVM
jgi:hypothetical protein